MSLTPNDENMSQYYEDDQALIQDINTARILFFNFITKKQPLYSLGFTRINQRAIFPYVERIIEEEPQLLARNREVCGITADTVAFAKKYVHLNRYEKRDFNLSIFPSLDDAFRYGLLGCNTEKPIQFWALRNTSKTPLTFEQIVTRTMVGHYKNNALTNMLSTIPFLADTDPLAYHYSAHYLDEMTKLDIVIQYNYGGGLIIRALGSESGYDIFGTKKEFSFTNKKTEPSIQTSTQTQRVIT